MSDLKARIGKRRRYPADDSGSVHSHIKKSSVNHKLSSSLGLHHSKYATSKYKPPFPTGSPSRALFQTSDSEPPSLLGRLDPMHADGASSRGDVVSLIDRIIGTKESHQFRELPSMDKSIIAETPVEAPHMPVYGNGSFVNIENATSPSRKGSSEQLNGGNAPISPPMTTAQTSHLPPTPTSQAYERFVRELLHSTAGAPIDKDPPPFLGSTDLNAQPGNRLQSPTPTIISRIRDVLLPLVMQSAQLRPGYGLEKAHPEKIKDKAKDILTDETCESFVGKVQSIERQMQAHQTGGYPTQGKQRQSPFSAAVEKVAAPDGIASTPSLAGPHNDLRYLPVPSSSMLPSSSIALPLSDGHPSSLPTPPISAPLPNAPTAPKAMRIHEFIYGSSQQIQPTPSPRPLSRKGKEKASNDLNQSTNNLPPRPQSHIDDDILRSQKPPRIDLDVHNNPVQSPGSFGIAIPMDSVFFESPTKGRARGDSVSTYYPSGRRSSSIMSQPFSPPSSSRFGRSSRHHLSRSPDGYRPRVRSPHYNDRSRRFSHRPRSRSRSHSPVHPVSYSLPPTRRGRELDRLLSPKNPSRIPTKNGTRRRSSHGSGSRSRPRYQLSRSPKYRGSDRPPEEAHLRNSRRSKSRSRSRSRSRLRSSTKYIPRHSDRESAQFDRPRESSLLLAKNHEPPRSSHRSRSRSRSTHRPIHSSRKGEHSTDDIFYGPSRPPQVDKAISMPPPVRIKRSLAEVMEPCRNVPGLWFIKMGDEGVRILECEIDIDRETSSKWNLFGNSQPDQGNLLHVQPQPYPLLLKLLCIPTQVIRSTYQTSNLSTATSEEIATKLFDLENEWPRKGTLVVAVNPHQTWGKTWLPIDLEPNSPALDLTACICEGTNVVRFIQLADMAEKVFVLCAMPPAAQDTDDETFWDLPKHLAMSPGPLKLRPAVVMVT